MEVGGGEGSGSSSSSSKSTFTRGRGDAFKDRQRVGAKRSFRDMTAMHRGSNMPGSWPNFGSGAASPNTIFDIFPQQPSPRLSGSPPPFGIRPPIFASTSTNTAALRPEQRGSFALPPQRFVGDGLDYRRPARRRGVASMDRQVGEGGREAVAVVDLTDEDAEEGAQARGSRAPGEAVFSDEQARPGPLLRQPTVIDVDDDDEDTGRIGGTGQDMQNAGSEISFLDNNSNGNVTRDATPYQANAGATIDLTAEDDEDDDDDVIITDSRVRENTGGVNLQPPGTTAGIGTRSAAEEPTFLNVGTIAGLMRGAGNNRLRERIQQAMGLNFLIDDPPPVNNGAGASRDGHNNNDDQIIRQDILTRRHHHHHPPRNLQHYYTHLQLPQPQPQQQLRDQPNQQNRARHHYHQPNQNQNQNAQNRPANPIQHPRRQPGYLQAYVGNFMDYQQAAFDLGIGGGGGGGNNALPPMAPEREYTPPKSPGIGFTRSPEEGGEALVCPNCGDELAVGEDEVKQQIWVIKWCGHAYCGDCARHRAKSNSKRASAKGGGKNSKGKSSKGKEPVVIHQPSTEASSLPLPFKTCVVNGCGRSASAKSMILIYPGS